MVRHSLGGFSYSRSVVFKIWASIIGWGVPIGPLAFLELPLQAHVLNTFDTLHASERSTRAKTGRERDVLMSWLSYRIDL